MLDRECPSCGGGDRVAMEHWTGGGCLGNGRGLSVKFCEASIEHGFVLNGDGVRSDSRKSLAFVGGLASTLFNVGRNCRDSGRVFRIRIGAFGDIVQTAYSEASLLT